MLLWVLQMELVSVLELVCTCCVRKRLVNTDGATDIWTDVWDYGRQSKTPSMARLSAVEMEECNKNGRETRRSSRPTLLRHQHVPLFCSIRDAVDLSGSLRVVLSSHVFLHRQSLKLSSASSRSLDGASTSRNVAFSSTQTRPIWCFGHSDGAPASALQSLLRLTAWSAHWHEIISEGFCPECPRLPFQSPTWNAYPAAWWTVLLFCII